MGGSESTPKKEEEKTTEVLTMHPSWESHVNEETNLGIFFSLFNIHISCVLSTLIFCLCIMICILLGYLGYRRFCHRPKRKIREAPSTCATCSSCTAPPAPLTSCPWAMNMEDKYYATMREQDDLNDYGSFYNFAPQRYGQQQPPSHYGQQQLPTRYGPQQPRYDSGQGYNGGSVFFCIPFLWQMRQHNRRLSIRRLISWHQFIKCLLLPMFSTWVLLPTTLMLLPPLTLLPSPTLLPTHDALYSRTPPEIALTFFFFVN
jgi:hypothetical protein